MQRLRVQDMESRYVDACANKRMKASCNHFGEKDGTAVGILVADGGGSTAGEEGTGRSMTCESHGFISVIGRRRVMEDAVTVVIGEIDSYDFFAVYDGHGGDQAANACRERLHLIVAKEVEERQTRGGVCGVGRGLGYWEDLMAACFMKMDEEVIRDRSSDVDSEMRSVGSTAMVVMVGKEELVAANCGDSRAVLCRGGVAVPLSCDHKVMTSHNFLLYAIAYLLIMTRRQI